MPMNLNLDNFEGEFSRLTPYILTSPTSIEACARIGVESKDLVYRSIEQYEEIFSDLPLSEVYRIYEKNETKRQEDLLKCRAMRHNIKSACGGSRRSKTTFGVKFKDEDKKKRTKTLTTTDDIRCTSDTESNDGDDRQNDCSIYSTRSVPDLRTNLDFHKPTWSPREYCPCQFQLDNESICSEYLKSCCDILSSPDLSLEDRKILECLALKKGQALEWDKKSQILRRNLERDRLRRYREEQLLSQKWQDRLTEKRRLENIENTRRYLEIQGKWNESRENLQKQLEDRDIRLRKYLDELKHRKRLHLVEKQKAEALRQLEVGKAIERIMEEDRNHRQRMREKLQQRMADAEIRKRRREHDYWRHIQEMNRLEDAKRCLKLERVEQNTRQNIEELRNQIEEKEHRAQMNYLALQRVRSNNLGQGAGSRNRAMEKAQLMHTQLMQGLQDWHKKVFELHTAAQDRAEMKYSQQISHRRARIASERVLREERALEMMRRVKELEDKRRELVLHVIDSKENKANRLKADKERKKQISRVRAQHAAELRQQLRERLDPETFDRKASRVELELRIMQKRSHADFSRKFVPRLFFNKKCNHCRCRHN